MRTSQPTSARATRRPRSVRHVQRFLLAAVLLVVLVVVSAATTGGDLARVRHSLFHGVYEFTTEGALAFYALEDDFPVENTVRVSTNEVPLVAGVDFVHDYLVQSGWITDKPTILTSG